MHAKVKFIYFDLGGILFDWRAAMDKIIQKLNISLKDFKKVFEKYDDEACRGNITKQELWQIYAHELRLKKPIDFDLGQFWSDNFNLIPDSHQLLRDLSQKYPIGLLTNIYHGVFPEVLDKGHIPNIRYGAIIQSCEIGFIKPEKEIYEIARTKANVKHEQILFLDDLKVNVDAAQKMGWKAVWFDQKNPQKAVAEVWRKLKGF